MKSFLSILCLFFLTNCKSFKYKKNDVIKIGMVGPVKDQVFEAKGVKHVIPTHTFINNYQTAIIDAKNRFDKNQRMVIIPILKYSEMIDYYIENLDGIIIAGSSGDLNPATYNQKVNPKTTPTSLEASNFDIELIKKAFSKKIPILGICYGMQVLAVASGGSLSQHIEGHMLTKHDIKIDKKSLLYKLNKQNISSNVNSFHHQAVAKISTEWLVSAKSDDGIIEGIENLKDGNYLFGVEWHPESSQENSMNMSIFDSFYYQILKNKFNTLPISKINLV